MNSSLTQVHCAALQGNFKYLTQNAEVSYTVSQLTVPTFFYNFRQSDTYRIRLDVAYAKLDSPATYNVDHISVLTTPTEDFQFRPLAYNTVNSYGFLTASQFVTELNKGLATGIALVAADINANGLITATTNTINLANLGSKLLLDYDESAGKMYLELDTSDNLAPAYFIDGTPTADYYPIAVTIHIYAAEEDVGAVRARTLNDIFASMQVAANSLTNYLNFNEINLY